MKEKYFRFSDDGEEITALIVGSKKAKAKFILYVPENTDGTTIYRIIKALDRKFRYRRTRKKGLGT